jgi:hypothetical protein
MKVAAFVVILTLAVFIWLTAVGRPSYLPTPKAPIAAVDIFWRDWVPVLLTAFFGAFLGWSEIISRYRDEPLSATWNQYGFIYIGFNAMVALGAFVLLERYPNILNGIDRHDGVMLSLLAGFGSMAVLRSKFFLYRTDDKREIPIGPDLVIDRFLKVIDRKIDRLRAARRQHLIFDLMRNYREYAAANEFFQLALTSLQNLSEDEKKFYVERANAVGLLPYPDSFKAMALGYLFLDVAGEENLTDVCGNLDKYLEEVRRSNPPQPGP